MKQKNTVSTPNEVFTFDEFSVRRYNQDDLNIGDTVWCKILGLPTSPRNGFWATVTEDHHRADFTQPIERITVRVMGTKEEVTVHPWSIMFEEVHSCECGATGGMSWRICHPDA